LPLSKAAAGILGCLTWLAPGMPAQTDWPTYGHDPGSSRYSPLKQITPKNVAKLTPAWTYHMTVAGPAPGRADAPPEGQAAGGRAGGGRAGRGGGRGRSSEATPIVANGRMYLPTPFGRVVALEPETGKELWVYESKSGNASTRGVEYWPGDSQSPAMILFGTASGQLVGLNAETGKPVPGFGVEGFVNLKQGIENGFPSGQFSLSSPPKIYKNLVITGARVQESPSLGYSGDTRAWDLHTGKMAWQFHSVPKPGEAGHETWEDDGWQNRSGVNVWGLFSVDNELGLVYLPYGSPSYDFYGGDRKGANLYANCLVALDAATGKVKWYFQGIHHDTWDYDFEAAPVLLNVKRNGKTIPALAEVSKQGLIYILDRRDGKPIFGMEDRPVPPSDLPGEAAWKTEPVPVKPAPVGRMSFKPEELAKLTPELEKFCSEMLAAEGGMHNDGPFTRYGSTLSIVFPGTLGASNWHGASYDPGLGYLFLNIINLADVGKVVKAPEGSPLTYMRTSPWGSFGRFWYADKYWPCQAPPWGEMVAINVNTGDVAWKVPFGVIEELEKQGIRNTGTMNMGGSIATAAGLVFIGATNDRRFRAFESKTGKVLWEHQLDAGAYATPLTYQGKDGKQYVTVVAAGGGYYDRVSGDAVVTFALP
jgi:glucose dehydrogenase